MPKMNLLLTRTTRTLTKRLQFSVLHDQLVGFKRNNDSEMSLYNLEYDICLIEAMSSSILKVVLAQVHYQWPLNYLQSFWYAVTFQLLIL